MVPFNTQVSLERLADAVEDGMFLGLYADVTDDLPRELLELVHVAALEEARVQAKEPEKGTVFRLNVVLRPIGSHGARVIVSPSWGTR